jgi:O-glycosyl hydrolase
MRPRAEKRRRTGTAIFAGVCAAVALLCAACEGGGGETVTADPTPGVMLSSTSVTFGDQVVDTSSQPQSVTITNNGNEALDISSVVISGTNAGDFSLVNGCGNSVAVAGMCSASLTFTPSGTGARSALLTISDNVSISPQQTIALSGTGVNNPVPSIASLAPPSAVVGAASQTLTLNGANFLSTSTVTYNGVAHAATFVNASQLTITLTAGDQAAPGNYPVVVTNPAPGGGPSNAANFAVNNPTPGLTSLSPPSTAVGSGAQTLTLTGTNFLPSATVTYDGVAHVATYVNSTQLTISLSIADQATAGNFSVVVTNPGPGGGASAPVNFAVDNPQPSLTSLAPPSAIAGAAAQTLMLNGTNFLASSTVTYNGVGHAATLVSSTQLTITLSAADQATAGNYAVVVTNPGPGGGSTAPLNFAVDNPVPSLTSLSPPSAIAGAGAQTLTLGGTNFFSTSTVTYNGVAHAATYVSSTQLTITLSAADQATAGSYPVVVTNPGPGGGSSVPLSFAVNNSTVSLTSLSPPSAVAGAGAQTLTLVGTGFLNVSTVTYNGVGHAATYVSTTELTISLSVADQSTAGSYPVVVTNPAPGGGSSTPLNFVVDNPQPTLTSLSPPSALVGSGAQTLTLNGTNFVAASTVTYDGVPHAATFVSSTELTISLTAPDQATAEDLPVVVTNPGPGGGSSNPVNFVVDNPAPSLTSLAPPSASAGAAAQTLTLNGANFLATSTVTYNGVLHAASFVNSSQLTITLSAPDQGVGGNYAVVVTNPGPGGGTSGAVNFAVDNPAPSLASLSPPSATAGAASQTLTLNGSNFQSTSTVTYNGVAHAATYVGATELTITLSTGDQATAGDYPVVVTNPAPGGGASSAVDFVIDNPAPTLTSLSPPSANAGAGSQTLMLNGTGFLPTSTVTYNGVAHAATYVSATELTITLGTGDQATAGSYPVVVTNPAPGGGASSSIDFVVNSVNPLPTLSSLSPPSAIVGAASQTLMLNGTNFVTTSTVTYNGVAHAATYVSATELTITLSTGDQAEAGSYPVVVTNPAPGGGASSAVSFVVDNPAPTLTSLSPPSANEGAASQTLMLNGSNFVATSSVTYNGVAHAATYVSATELTITLSTGDQATAGSYPVVVTNPAPGGGISSSVDFVVNTVNPQPSLTSLSPPSAIAGAGSQTLTLNGSNFLTTSTVTYNGVAHAATFLGATQLTIMLSAGDQSTAGSYPVVVINPAPGGGASSAVNFAVNNPAPNLTSLSPPSAIAGAASQTLTLIGANFLSTSTVTYNGVSHPATFVNSTQLTITLSTGDQATAGTYPVVVTNPAPGGGSSAAVNFSVNNLTVSVTSLSPPTAVAGAASQTLTINGANFLPTSTVTYNGVSHAATYVSSAELTITLSTGDQSAAGEYPVVVTNPSPGGGSSTPLDFEVDDPQPTLASLAPPSATAGAASQTLTLNGTNFLPTSTVTYNGVSHAATYVNPTELAITLTSGDQATAASYPVVVTNPSPGGGSSTAVNFTVNNPAPSLTSLAPPSATVGAASQTLTLIGTNFLATSTVTFNGVSHAATYGSSTQLTITLTTGDQATAGSFPVVVTNPAPGGGVSGAVSFVVDNSAPSLTSLAPPSANAGAASQTLTLNGTNFLSTSTVTYNGVSHAATYVSSTELTISLSAGDQAAAGNFPVVVTNPAPGGGASSAVNFVVDNPAPTLTSLSPPSASAGAASQTLTLNGTNYLTTSTVTYNGANHAATYMSSTQLTITLSTVDQAAAGEYPVVVTNPGPGGGSSGSVNFEVDNQQPSLTSLSPPSSIAGSSSQTLTLNGANFLATSTVTYNGASHAATYISATQLTITLSLADQATAGSYSVVVTNPAPGGGSSSAVNFVVDNPAPTLTSLSPPSATAGAASQTLTLNGTNFLATSTVTYNGAAHAATYVSPTQLAITLSAGDQATTGGYPVVVTNPAPGGGNSNTLTFSVNSGGIAVGFSTTSVNFGNQLLLVASSPQPVTVTNNGTANLNISNITISGTNAADFGETDNCGNPVGAGSNCTINITFVPSLAGPETATVTIADNAAGSPQEIALMGTGASVSVNWSSVRQTIDGFGGAAVGAAEPLPANLATFFFSPSSGIGLSIVRLQVLPDSTTCSQLCTTYYADEGVSGCGCVSSSGATILTGELGIVQQAQANGVATFFATSWSPPASTKSNDSWFSGGSFLGGSTNYASYAALLESYVSLLSSNGVALFGISPQNEPDISQSYQSALWTAQQFHDFIPYLSSALSGAGFGAVNIILPENSGWSSNYDGFTQTTMSDPAVAPQVGLLAQHGYNPDSSIVALTNYGYGQHVWMTEVSSQSSEYDGSMTDALLWASRIHSYLATAQVNAFVWWGLSDMLEQGNGTDNGALTDFNGDIPLRAYITGNWSRFVRPGWHRVDVSNAGSLLVTAFQSADDTQSAIVVVNNTSSDSAQVLNVGQQMAGAVVPWITSASQQLVQQSTVPTSDGTITYTIPADSVVTFVSQTPD